MGVDKGQRNGTLNEEAGMSLQRKRIKEEWNKAQAAFEKLNQKYDELNSETSRLEQDLKKHRLQARNKAIKALENQLEVLSAARKKSDLAMQCHICNVVNETVRCLMDIGLGREER